MKGRNFGSMRQILELPSTTPFSRKETAGRGVVGILRGRHVGILPHTSDYFFIPFGCLPMRPCLPRCLRQIILQFRNNLLLN